MKREANQMGGTGRRAVSPPVFSGSMVALVTPFRGADTLKPAVDEKALRDLVEWQIAEGTDVIVPCGTTGESATLDYEEHDRVIRIVVDEVRGRVPVLAGTGSNATAEAIEMTRHAKEIGADGSLQVTPYYNRPTQEGLFLHFKTIAEAPGLKDLPMILYNVPGRTGVNLLPETVARCAEIKNIIGIKEASGNLDQVRRVVELCGPDFVVLSGEDAQNFEILEAGGRGTISVTANVAPSRLARMGDLFAAGKREETRKVHEEVLPLHRAMFLETNPIPVKTALGMMGKCSDTMRLPLCRMGETNRQRLSHVLKEYRLL